MIGKSDSAIQTAFENGQYAWRGGKSLDKDNPYPPHAIYFDHWRQGWEAEDEIQKK
ncbi:MAG: hypothetical protein ABI230_01275 [Aestuariivirga sp.]